jgi:hypothetical protein
MSDAHADQIRHWLAVADDQDNQEKELAARYTAAAAARLWVLHKLDGGSGDAPDTWAQVRELAEQADDFLDDDRQDEALYRRAQANLIALRLFEDSDEPQRPSDDDSDGDKAEDKEAEDKEKETAGTK